MFFKTGHIFVPSLCGLSLASPHPNTNTKLYRQLIHCIRHRYSSKFMLTCQLLDFLWISLKPKLKKKKFEIQMKYLLDLLYQLGFGKMLFTKKKNGIIKISINSSILWIKYPSEISLKSIAKFYFGLIQNFFKENTIFEKEKNVHHLFLLCTI